MPAAKRAASQGKAAATPKAAKKNFAGWSAAPVEDSFVVAVTSVLALADNDAELHESAREMLRAAAPFALSAPKGERHRFQAELVTMLDGICERVEALAHARLQAAEAEVAQVESEREASAVALNGAKAEEGTFAAMLAAAEDAQKEADVVLSIAQSSLGEAKAAEDVQKLKGESVVTQMGERETFMCEAWEALKSGSVAKKDWRQRNKMIDSVTKILQECDAGDALTLAIPMAFKLKPEDRGFFAQDAVKFAEQALKESVAAFGTAIATLNDVLATAAQEVAAAEEGVATAKMVQGERQTTWVDAENALQTATQAKAAADEAAEALNLRALESKQALVAATAAQEHLAGLLATYAAIVEGGAAATRAEVMTSLPETGVGAFAAEVEGKSITLESEVADAAVAGA